MTDDVRLWTVPGRVNLVGEHLDHNGGAALPIAIDRTLTIKARRRDDGVVNVWSRGEKATFGVDVALGEVGGWAAYVAGVVWSFRQTLVVPGVDLVIESDLPIGAGLSSSAALTCGVALAIDDVAGYRQSREQLAWTARGAERFAGAPVGLMDPYAVLLAEAGHALHVDFSSDPPATRQVPVDWESAGLTLLVISTGVTHAIAAGEYAARRDECARAADELGLEYLAQAGPDAVIRLTDDTLKARARHVFTEAARVRGAVNAIAQGAWQQLGTIMLASHASLRDDFEVSCPELDVAVEAAVEAGALGARMTGGGFGGSAIALVPHESVTGVRERVEARYDDRRWPRPDIFGVRASGGAVMRED